MHNRILTLFPKGKLWFLDGKDDKGKVVTNPNIGYGVLTIRYADGKTKEFYQVGISANTTGISVYIMGIQDKNYLPNTYGKRIGKASVTGYCIKFKMLKDIDLDVLEEAIRDGVKSLAAKRGVQAGDRRRWEGWCVGRSPERPKIMKNKNESLNFYL